MAEEDCLLHPARSLRRIHEALPSATVPCARRSEFEKRLANIRTTVAKSTNKIFWFTTIDSINRDGIWSPVWLRPTGGQLHSLL